MNLVAYVAFSAVSINPDRECNPTIGTGGVYGVGPQVIGLAISFLSIIWLSGMTSRRMAAILGAGGIAQSGIYLFYLFNFIFVILFFSIIILTLLNFRYLKCCNRYSLWC